MVISIYCLNVITICLSSILKIPQLLCIYKKECSDGVSHYSAYAELIGYTLICMRNRINGNNILSYLEYPILSLQQLILIYFITKYSVRSYKWAFQAFCVYILVVLCFITEVISPVAFTPIARFIVPFTLGSKILQLIMVISNRGGKNVSLLTWSLSTITSLLRLLTYSKETDDFLLVFHFTVSTTFSFGVMCAVVLFRIIDLSPEDNEEPG